MESLEVDLTKMLQEAMKPYAMPLKPFKSYTPPKHAYSLESFTPPDHRYSPAPVPAPSREDVIALLERADSLIYEKGWHQGSAKSEKTGAICAEYALSEATEHNSQNHIVVGHCSGCKLLQHALFALAQALPYGHSVPAYNDTLGVTEEDIHELYRKAIKRLVNAPTE